MGYGVLVINWYHERIPEVPRAHADDPSRPFSRGAHAREGDVDGVVGVGRSWFGGRACGRHHVTAFPGVVVSHHPGSSLPHPHPRIPFPQTS